MDKNRKHQSCWCFSIEYTGYLTRFMAAKSKAIGKVNKVLVITQLVSLNHHITTWVLSCEAYIPWQSDIWRVLPWAKAKWRGCVVARVWAPVKWMSVVPRLQCQRERAPPFLSFMASIPPTPGAEFTKGPRPVTKVTIAPSLFARKEAKG